MITLRRHETSFDRASAALSGFVRRRVAEAVGLCLLAAAIIAAIAMASWSVNDPSLNNATAAPVRNLVGAPGAVAADLLIQMFGLGAVALVLVPAAWGVRLMRGRGFSRPVIRVVLWLAGSATAAATASALPPTSRWPLPTGLGGVTGDVVLGAARTIGQLHGATGSALLGLGFAALAILALSAACGFGVEIAPAESADRPARGRAYDDRDDARDEEPSFAIVALGAAAHAVMSLKAGLRRKLEAGIEHRRLRHAEAESRHEEALWAAREAAATRTPPTRREPVPAALRRDAERREPAFDDDMPVLPAATARKVQPLQQPADEPELDVEDEIDTPVAPDVGRSGRTIVVPDQAPLDTEMDAFADETIDDEPLPDPLPELVRREAARVEMPRTSRGPVAVAAGRKPVEVSARPAPPATRRIDAPAGAPEVYQLPPLQLLTEAKKQVATVSKDALEQNATLLESTLEDFGVRGEIINVRPGPVVTLYELEPAPGTKSSRVIGLADDIARSMSAVSARVAVVQGRNAIGIELPNLKRETVFLRELLATEDFAVSKHKLAIALGKTIGGEPVIADLARMPHLLVAGTTGSGKSVAINTMILSLLYLHKPEACRLIMVDPKMLELSVYDGIPHLLTPVVTDPKKAVVALKWAVREMEERYKKMSKLGVRNIDGFNARVAEAAAKHEVITRTVQTGFDRETGEAVYEDEIMDLVQIPYIVVIVDEMADLMMVAGKDIEGAIQRLAQMARAAGIHLIMATQRPSVDVITGTIKANFPTRISFQVTSKIDSRTILGEMGAEQLLGQGDMLYMAGGGRITRVHGPFVSDLEVEKVVAHLKRQGRPQYLDSVTVDDEGGTTATAEDTAVFDKGAFGDEPGDPYDQAVAVVLRDKKASTSYIQRRLGIGYNRAASIMERMETEGIVGPANHAGKREILLEGHDAGMDD